MEHEVDGDGAAEHLGQITGADGEFAEQPVGPAGPARVPIAAALGEVLSGDHAQTGGDDLHEDGHQAGEADHPEQSVFELRAARQIGAPVARVHVADADREWPVRRTPAIAARSRLDGGGTATLPCIPSSDMEPGCETTGTPSFAGSWPQVEVFLSSLIKSESFERLINSARSCRPRDASRRPQASRRCKRHHPNAGSY